MDNIKERLIVINDRAFLVKKPRIVNNRMYIVAREEGISNEINIKLDTNYFDGSEDSWIALCSRKLLDFVQGG
jgi:hypothetical protein